MLRFVGLIIDIKGDQDFLYTRESNLKLKMGVDWGGGVWRIPRISDHQSRSEARITPEPR